MRTYYSAPRTDDSWMNAKTEWIDRRREEGGRRATFMWLARHDRIHILERVNLDRIEATSRN